MREPVGPIGDDEDPNDYRYFIQTEDGKIHQLSYQGLVWTFQVGNIDNIVDTWREL